MSEFIRELHKGNKNCNIKVISAEEHREELIQDAFINRLASPLIRQHILENKQLDLQTAFDQANALDRAHKNSEAYMTPVIKAATAMASSQVHERKEVTISTITHSESSLAAKQSYERRCFFCGGVMHSRTQCTARDENCHKCGTKSRFGKLCRSKKNF